MPDLAGITFTIALQNNYPPSIFFDASCCWQADRMMSSSMSYGDLIFHHYRDLISWCWALQGIIPCLTLLQNLHYIALYLNIYTIFRHKTLLRISTTIPLCTLLPRLLPLSSNSPALHIANSYETSQTWGLKPRRLNTSLNPLFWVLFS